MNKTKKIEKHLEEGYSDSVDEDYRPFLIHFSTYAILTDEVLMLMPSQRNVLLSMNQYDLSTINPAHPKTLDAPTHIIIFCIRFIEDDTFQPIGGLLTYKQIDQSFILAECIKAYINDLWKLNLHVVATVSPPSKIFKDILKHLILETDVETHLDVISYSVEPIKEIIHIFDVQYLIIKLQNLLQGGDIRFRTLHQGSKVFTACWTDIAVTVNAAPEFKMISDFLSSAENVQRRVHIFTEQLFVKYIEVRTTGLLSANADGCAELLNAVRTFLKFFEYDFVHPPEHTMLNWSDLIYILGTMTFQKTDANKINKSPSTLEDVNICIKKKLNNNNKNTKDKKKKKKNSIKVSNDENGPVSKESLTPIYELCDILDKTKVFGVDNGEVPISVKSRNKPFDLKAALLEMDCDINLMNYDNAEDVDIQNNYINQTKKDFQNNHVDKNKNVDIKKKGKSVNFSIPDCNSQETETDVQNGNYCDKIPVLENKEEPPGFAGNSITQELICTVKSIKQLMSLMALRRVRQIKPDALIVEHIDYFVTKIQSAINLMDSVRYYGHQYNFMDAELAFSTLKNTKGLYLISKD